jgi:uncharacterized membrane protein affecting hemolysin expression
MKKDTTIIISLAIVFITLFFIYIFRGGHNPIALVHGNWISNRQFSREYQVYAKLYQEFGKANKIILTNDKAFQLQVGRDGLDRLVESVLIKKAIDDLSSREIDNELKELIKTQMESDNVKLFQSLIGNISEKDFNRAILSPMAERELLKNYFESQSQSFDNWLSSTKKSARVVIFSDEYDWDGEKIVIKT